MMIALIVLSGTLMVAAMAALSVYVCRRQNNIQDMTTGLMHQFTMFKEQMRRVVRTNEGYVDLKDVPSTDPEPTTPRIATAAADAHV